MDKGILMARLLRGAILIGLLLAAKSALASGGSCPEGANYLNSSTNSLVTLSSLGVTQCYYIAASGSDSNSGTSESSPWLHAPQMPNCSANCAAVQNATIPPGTGLILRGGDTWHFGNSGATPYAGGSWNFNVSPYPMGSSGSPIYLGVDKNWYSGNSWVRPILDGDNPPTTSQSLASCPYAIGSPGGFNVFINLSGLQYYIVDSFEMTGMCQQDVGGTGTNVYVDYGSLRNPIYLYNLYIHGWSHVAFNNLTSPNGPNACGAAQNLRCWNMWAFYGSVNPLGAAGGEVLYNNVVDGSDSDQISAGVCYCGFYDIAYNYFGHSTQMIVRSLHSYHDNLVEYIIDNGHGNVLESVGDAAGTNTIYNNIWRHIGLTGNPGEVGVWLFPQSGSTDYFFNNLSYDLGQIEVFNVGTAGTRQTMGTQVIFNNTWQIKSGVSEPVLGCSAMGYPYPFTTTNNLFITDTSPPYNSNCTTQGQGSFGTDLTMSNATATAKGYTSSATYAYSPTSSSSPTVKTGTTTANNNAAFCAAISSAASSDSTLIDAAAACQSDTRYACTYDSTSHTVSCPGRSAIPRPSSGAWDIGVYQFGTSATSAPNPPVGLTAIVQ